MAHVNRCNNFRELALLHPRHYQWEFRDTLAKKMSERRLNSEYSIDQAIEILRAYCPHCSPEIAQDTLVANKWEVAQITIGGFANEDYKCAIHIYTAEEPFPFYKWTNAPFFSKVGRVWLFVACRLTP